jgi:hypothetical protein
MQTFQEWRNSRMKSADIEQRERRAYAGSTTGMTYHSRALSHIELEGQGRHAAEAKASVSGREPFVKYPRMPEGSPWHADIVPPEPGLGYAINDLEVTGEPHELATSIVQLPEGDDAAATDGNLSRPSGAEDGTTVVSSSGDAPAPSALFPLAAEGAPSNVIAAHPPEPEAPVHARVGVDDAAPLVNDADASGATLQLRRGRKL